MKYLLDTANLDELRELSEYLPIAGVTSNPTIVKKEGAVPFFAHMREIRGRTLRHRCSECPARDLCEESREGCYAGICG